MSLLTLLVALAAFGVLLWLSNRFLPAAYSTKRVLNSIPTIALAILLLYMFNVIGPV